MSALGDDAPRTATLRFGVDVLEDVHAARPVVVDFSAVTGTISTVAAEQLAATLERQAAKLRAAVATVNAARIS